MAKAYTVLDKSTMPNRDSSLLPRPNPYNNHIVDPYDLVAPGLYPDERLVELDTGEKIAVSVESEWKENGSGVVLLGVCRVVNDDGSTKLAPDGKPIEVYLSGGYDHDWLNKFTTDQLGTEMIRLMLGEEPTMIPVENSGSRKPPEEGYPEGTVVYPDATEVPMIPYSKESLENGSIRAAIKHVSEMQSLNLSL